MTEIIYLSQYLKLQKFKASPKLLKTVMFGLLNHRKKENIQS